MEIKVFTARLAGRYIVTVFSRIVGSLWMRLDKRKLPRLHGTSLASIWHRVLKQEYLGHYRFLGADSLVWPAKYSKFFYRLTTFIVKIRTLLHNMIKNNTIAQGIRYHWLHRQDCPISKQTYVS
jgi:hypothetical protein